MKPGFRFALPVLAPAAGAGGAYWMLQTPKRAERARPEPLPPLVEVMEVQPSRQVTKVLAMGTVMPAQSVVLQAEVTGRVMGHSPELVPGGVVKKGEVLVRLDAREHQLAVEQQQAAVERAEFELAVEEGRRRIAEKEWSLVGDGAPAGGEGRALALREPHIKAARAAVLSAKSGLDRAQLSVARSTIVAPFSALVREETVEVGQLVTPQTQLAALVGTDQFWVQVSVPVAELDRIQLPSRGGDGAKAWVAHDAGGTQAHEREGRVVRLLGEVDPRGKMARLLVAVDDPLALRPEAEGSAPLLLGSYVEVSIEGRALDGIFVLPRSAVREGDRAWLVNADGKLEIRGVEVAWRDRGAVYVTRGLGAGDRVITSRLSTPVEGMALRTAGTPPARPRVAQEGAPQGEGRVVQ